MTTLIITTFIFLVVLVLAFALGMIYTIKTINENLVDSDDVLIAMVSTLGLIWSIVSLITFYKLVF